MSLYPVLPLLSPRQQQTAQDVSSANVQALFQWLSSRRGCPSAAQPETEREESPEQTDQKSVTVNGKWLLTPAGLWL